MNQQLDEFARTWLKDNLAKLPAPSQRIFKLMYGRKNGKRSVAETELVCINSVVDEMEPEKLDLAMKQVSNSLSKVE